MKTLFTFLLLALCRMAPAADSYGYLAFWQHPSQPEVVTVTKTTREDAGAKEAAAELRAFCRMQDRALAGGSAATGCLSVTPLHNSCAAAAWPSAQGLLKHSNVVIVRTAFFADAGPGALRQCRLKYGEAAACEVETVFCTFAQAYAAGQTAEADKAK